MKGSDKLRRPVPACSPSDLPSRSQLCAMRPRLCAFLGNGKTILAIHFHERYLLWQKGTGKGMKIWWRGAANGLSKCDYL